MFYYGAKAEKDATDTYFRLLPLSDADIQHAATGSASGMELPQA